jgi:hypothetical protein
MDTVEDCGDYWHTSWGNQSGLYTRNPWQPRRAYDGWGDMNIGHAQSISISPRNGRIWIDDEDSPDHPLRTGMPPRFGVFDLDSHAAKGCIDVCLVPWADTDTDLLLLTVTQPINSRPRLIINEWKERRSEFFTRDELNNNPALGFAQGWWEPQLPEGILMARVFRASDQDYVYLVHRTDKNLYALSYVKLYNRRAMWRVNHEDLLKTQGVWKPVQPPSGYMTDPDANLANPDANPSGLKPAGFWSPNIAGWWSNGLNDLHA